MIRTTVVEQTLQHQNQSIQRCYNRVLFLVRGTTSRAVKTIGSLSENRGVSREEKRQFNRELKPAPLRGQPVSCLVKASGERGGNSHPTCSTAQNAEPMLNDCRAVDRLQ